MTTDNALLQAILTDPSDDLPRLAYADWCEEQGHTSRARFIQAQMALFHGPRGYKTETECPRSLQHHWREDRDLYRRAEKECKPSPEEIAQELFGKPSAEVEFEFTVDFERGFLFHIETTQAAFMENAERIFRRCPVEWVVLTDRVPHILPARGDWERFYWMMADPDIAASLQQSEASVSAELYRLGEVKEVVVATGEPVEHRFRYYPSPGNAHADLARACVRYGRILTGLPDLWTRPRAQA